MRFSRSGRGGTTGRGGGLTRQRSAGGRGAPGAGEATVTYGSRRARREYVEAGRGGAACRMPGEGRAMGVPGGAEGVAKPPGNGARGPDSTCPGRACVGKGRT